MKEKIISRRAFTLTEILIVVTIIAILAALAIPRLTPQAERGRASEAIGILSAIRQGEEAYFLENGVYLPNSPAVTTQWPKIGMDDPNTGNRFFDYDVTTNAPTNTTFLARAERNDIMPGGANGNGANPGNRICIDETGTYFGTHTNTPSNAGVAPGSC